MKKENIKLSIIILILIITSLSTTYAFLEIRATDQSATGEAGCFNVSYSGNSINNISINSDADYTKGANTTITLSKDEDCEIYTQAEIHLDVDLYYCDTETATESLPCPIPSTKVTATDALNTAALNYKIVVDSGDGKILGENSTTLTEKSATITSTGDITLANVTLTETSTTYKIYLWIDKAKSIGYFNNTGFSGSIYAKSEQTSTITN